MNNSDMTDDILYKVLMKNENYKIDICQLIHDCINTIYTDYDPDNSTIIIKILKIKKFILSKNITTITYNTDKKLIINYLRKYKIKKLLYD